MRRVALIVFAEDDYQDLATIEIEKKGEEEVCLAGDPVCVRSGIRPRQQVDP